MVDAQKWWVLHQMEYAEMTGCDLCLGLVFSKHMVPQVGPKMESNEIAMVAVSMLCKTWLA